MRALILVAGAALAVAACSSNDNANNTMNADENMTAPTENVDMNAPADMNAMNADVNAAGAANAAADTANAAANNANAAANNAM
ncbi:MAG TPA: hypothetical protein VF067_04685 [Sphingomicrobium sp.]|jgi:uncharacterized lipoprotein